MQNTTIYHVIISNGEIGGAKVSEIGLDLNDHSIVIGWVKAPPGIMIKKEMKGVKIPLSGHQIKVQRRDSRKRGAGSTTTR